ncbi:hypothetical protein F0562_028628 [Nyssa sinensis]|uniref:Pentacotripeptide-repeat region of PRORP domain-containing protein n=1 Tax=Nyssa sinensis TaxID=561372 RepID=A0A5J5B0U2_9ASTE|nr:hypothetical protein F0562_028628 [Nyssa sinensis]
MHSTFTKLRNCKTVKSCHRFHLYLFGSFRSISISNNPTERRPLGKLEPYYNNSVDFFRLNHALQEFADFGDVRAGMSVHTVLIKFYYKGFISLWNKLLSLYLKCGQFGVARQLFESMPKRDVVSFNTMISACVHNNHGLEAVHLYSRMGDDNATPNHITLAGLIGACDRVGSVQLREAFHSQAIRYGFSSNEYVGSSLVDGYSKEMKLDDAIKAFGEIAELDLVSWNVMIDGTMGKHDKVSCTAIITGFGQHGKGREALEILDEMTREGLNPDAVTFLACLSACSHGGHVDEGIWVFRIMIDVYNLKPRREHFSSVVDMLGRAGRLNEAERFIEEMGIESEVFVWETLLGACRLHGEMALGEKSAKKIIELQPERHGPFVLLSNMYADKGLWEDKGVVRENLVVSGLKKEAGCSWVALQRF